MCWGFQSIFPQRKAPKVWVFSKSSQLGWNERETDLSTLDLADLALTQQTELLPIWVEKRQAITYHHLIPSKLVFTWKPGFSVESETLPEFFADFSWMIRSSRRTNAVMSRKEGKDTLAIKGHNPIPRWSWIGHLEESASTQHQRPSWKMWWIKTTNETRCYPKWPKYDIAIDQPS